MDRGQRETVKLEVTPTLLSGWNPSASVLELRPFCILETVRSLGYARLTWKDEIWGLHLHWGVFLGVLLPHLPLDQAHERYVVERTQPVGIGLRN